MVHPPKRNLPHASQGISHNAGDGRSRRKMVHDESQERSREGDSETQERNPHGEGFVEPREHVRQKERRQKRAQLVMGKKSDTRIEAAGTINIMVKYVSKRFGDDEMKKYVVDEGVEVHSVETVSHANAKTKSFRIEIDFKDKDKVLNPEFWPTGIGLKVWRHRNGNQAAMLPGAIDGSSAQNDQSESA